MDVLLELEAVLAPCSRRLVALKANPLYRDFAAAGSTLLPIKQFCQNQSQRTVVFLGIYGID